MTENRILIAGGSIGGLAAACGLARMGQAALQNYQEMRLVRTARLQMNSRLIGDYIYHPADAQTAVRDGVMTGMCADVWYERLAWLCGSIGLENAA